METAFPDRYVLLIISILIISGCGSQKEYGINPIPVSTEIVEIDSFYTTTLYVPTGGGDSLFSGIKSNFDSYALLKFDSIPVSFDSVSIKLKSDSTQLGLCFHQITDEWYEDSLYEWEDIGMLINTSTVLQTSLVNTKNPEIKLNGQSLNVINEYGIAIHSDSFYSFASREENEPKLIIYQGDSTYNLHCLGDLYIVKNPYNNLLKDSLLIGRGISIKPHLFIPVDSLPPDRDNLARVGLLFKLEEPPAFDIIAYDTSGNEYSSECYTVGDTSFIEFDLRTLLKSDFSECYIHVTLGAKNELEGIDVLKFFQSELRLMWAEIGKK